MNIFYINHYAGSTTHGMEYRPYYLAREWIKDGHNVTIIASSYSHLRKVNPEFNSSYLDENIDGINYIWCKTPKYEGNGLNRVINIFVFLRRLSALAKKLIKDFKPDIVIASSTYPFDTKIAHKIAKKSQAKFIYEIHDLWPLTPIELHSMSKYHPYIWLMQKAEDFGFKSADKIISILPKIANYMLSRGFSVGKLACIPNGINLEEWQHQIKLDTAIADTIEQIKNNFELTIGYAGGMSESNALEYLIAAATKTPNIAFILVGNGTHKKTLENTAATSSNIFFFPAINKNRIPDFLAKMDVLYIGWHNIPIYRYGISPNKIFDYMMAKKPILHSISLGNDWVQECNCGISVPAENVEAITYACEKFRLMPENERQRLGQNGYQYVINTHDYKILARRFVESIQ